MLIVLDTNIVFHDPLLQGRPLDVLSKLARRAGDVEIALPDVVLAELTRQIKNAADAEIVRVKASNKFWAMLGSRARTQPEPDADQLARDWRVSLGRRMRALEFTTLATPMNEEQLISRFKRAGRPLKRLGEPGPKKRSAEEEEPWVKGLGDVLLWEAVRHAVTEDDVVLVSNDRKAFADGKADADPTTGLTPLAADLVREIREAGSVNQLYYCTSLAELHKALIALQVIEDQHVKGAILEHEVKDAAFQEHARELVVDAIREAVGQNVAGADVDWPHVGPAELAADPDVQHVEILGDLTFGDVLEVDADDFAVEFSGTAELQAYLWAHVFSLIFAFADEFPPAVSFGGYDSDASVADGEWHGQVSFDGTMYVSIDDDENVTLDTAELQALNDLMPNAEPAIRDDRGRPIDDEF